MNKIAAIVFAIHYLFCFSINAQETEGGHVLSNMIENYKGQKEYALELDYKMYMGHSKDTLKENYVTKVFKTDESFKMNMNDYDMYVFDTLQVTLVENEKTIYVNKKSIDAESGLILKSIENLKASSSVTILSKTKKEIVIRVKPEETTANKYDKIDLTVGLPDYNMINQTVYYNYALNYKDLKGGVIKAKPCLVLSIKDYKGPKVIFLNQEDILTSKGEGFVPSSKYNDYKLIDQRQ